MELSRKIDEKKFMWDGETYEKEDNAKKAMENYQRDGFEVKMVEEDGKYYVFTRRVVTEVKVEGAPPM